MTSILKMEKPRAFMLAGLALLVLGVGTPQGRPAKAQTPQPDPDEQGIYRFAGVEKWQGTFSYNGKGSASEQVPNGFMEWKAAHTAEGSFTMEGPTYPEPWRNAAVWEGPATGYGTIDDEITITDMCEEYTHWTGSGPMPGVIGAGGPPPGELRARLTIDFDEGTYLFIVSPEGVDGQEYIRHTCGNGPPSESTGSWTTQLGAGGFTQHMATGKLPQNTLAIQDSITFDDRLPQMWDISEVGGIATWNYNWALQPAGEDKVELEVAPVNFATWLPEGGTARDLGGIGVGANEVEPAAALSQSGANVEFTGGNTLTITAKLVDADGGPLKQKAKKFTFELIEVSQEPGIAMNAPKVQANAPPDLEFVSWRNYAFNVRTEGSTKAVTANEGPMTEASAVLTANDYGAWGLLKVTAQLESGQLIVGYLEGDKEQKEIRIPKRKIDSKVADYWKEQHGATGKDDTDDLELAPEGNDGCPGDGLSLYEEYRGFFEKGQHFRTTPVRRDFFVVDRIGTRYSKMGIAVFKQATLLETHGEMLLSEVSDNMVINFNKGTAHVVDQHGVQMVSQPSPGMPGASIKKPGYRGSGTPGTFAWIIIDSGMNPRASQREAERYASIVAHELAHTVGVAEHGQGDKFAQWLVFENDEGVLAVHESVYTSSGQADPVEIVVKREDGSIIPATDRIFGVEDGLMLTIGVDQGQHSGVEACLMRYDVAWAYISDTDPNVRYYVHGDDERGTILCRTTNGTGINDTSHRPQSRYGPTLPNLGDCVHQICVNDLNTR